MPKDLIKKLVIKRLEELEGILIPDLISIPSNYVIGIILPEIKNKYPHENLDSAHDQALIELENEGFEVIGNLSLGTYMIKRNLR